MIYTYIIIALFAKCVYGWDTKQLEVFDVVEEVKVKFYEFLSVPQDADIKSIKSAFRKLSIKLHPDKNPAPDAEEQFRNLVSIYDVLRDTEKRKYYDEVLEKGLPNWRSAIYYYRHVRRVGLLELFLFLIGILSIGQYIVGWAAYLERVYTMEQIKKKKSKNPPQMPEIPKPSLKNTLPVQIPSLVWAGIVSLPEVALYIRDQIHDYMHKPVEEPDEEPVARIRPARKPKPAFTLPDYAAYPTESCSAENINSEAQAVTLQVAPIKGGLWTDDDLAELVQLVNRYPGGTPDRWKVIANIVNRSVDEVTYMTNMLKTNNFRLSSQNESNETVNQPRVKKKKKESKVEELLEQTKAWSQDQQRAMENALAKFPKGTIDRWDRIAEYVPEKTKEECMLRYKHIVEIVKKQKEGKETQNLTATEM